MISAQLEPQGTGKIASHGRERHVGRKKETCERGREGGREEGRKEGREGKMEEGRKKEGGKDGGNKREGGRDGRYRRGENEVSGGEIPPATC